MMKMDDIILKTTDDGTPTLYNSRLGEHYHSTHGALQESQHIFIDLALRHRLSMPYDTSEGLRVLEYGFGTGLNALLTLRESIANDLRIRYTTLELYPLEAEIYERLDYPLPTVNGRSAKSLLMDLHLSPWGEATCLSGSFALEKIHTDCELYIPQEGLDLIYFDAFSPEVQGHLWAEAIFERLYRASRVGAMLTTYCAKGEVRRRLERAGWYVERLPGPPGKREMLRATKQANKRADLSV